LTIFLEFFCYAGVTAGFSKNLVANARNLHVAQQEEMPLGSRGRSAFASAEMRKRSPQDVAKSKRSFGRLITV
jgi:hypothetical protein